ncbi:MAG: glycogen debranching protein, partial [Bacteroidota bacterium]
MGDLLAETPSLVGKEDYLPSPFVTAGNRVYMVGHQDGTFPSLGWHIKGEMGGIWNHPIKLMDGFDIDLHFRDGTDRLNKADRFTNYPFANQHTFHLKERGLTIERWQFVPDDVEGLVLQLVITNNSDQLQEFKLIFTGHTDLRPTWLGERNNMIDGPDNGRYHPALGGWIVKDSLNPWYVAFAADRKPGNRGTITNTKEGLGSSHTLAYTLTLAPNAEKYINIAIAGSYKNEDRALQSLQDLQYDWPKRFEAKQQRYQQLAKQTKLSVPDPKIQTTFEWLKYNCDWLVRTVPEIGTGIGAGIPDYPWWFGVDSEYALMGYMAIGQEQPVYKTIRLLDSVSNVVNRGNGRIIHEMSSNGAVFNPGNINETPQFASLIWQIYQWNGDDAFLKRYFPTVRKGLAWLIADNDDDGNGFPEGFGMMEIHGLDSEMIDVASYTQKGFADAAQIARALGDTLSARRYTNKANRLKDQINTQFWSEDFGAYADFIGTDKQALHLLEDALVRADTLDKPWATAELEATRKYIIENPSDTARPFVMHRNWVVNTPMEVGLADSTKALQALETAKRYVNPFGVFVTGIDRDASAGADAGAYKAPPIFNYTGAVMTLPTGVQARAENNYGRPNVALNYLERMVRSFSYALPGSMYEVSPDFGMMVQAWNIYSFAYPIVHQFF